MNFLFHDYIVQTFEPFDLLCHWISVQLVHFKLLRYTLKNNAGKKSLTLLFLCELRDSKSVVNTGGLAAESQVSMVMSDRSWRGEKVKLSHLGLMKLCYLSTIVFFCTPSGSV